MKSMRELLETAGATHLTAKRANCPRCKGRQTISYTSQLFCCHHFDCNFKGSAESLAHSLGMTEHLSRAEQARDYLHRKRTLKLALQVFDQTSKRHHELCETHRIMLDIKFACSQAIANGTCDDETWGRLKFAMRTLDLIAAELDYLGSASATELLEFHHRTPEARRALVACAIRNGGWKFRDGSSVVCEPCLPGQFSVKATLFPGGSKR